MLKSQTFLITFIVNDIAKVFFHSHDFPEEVDESFFSVSPVSTLLISENL